MIIYLISVFIQLTRLYIVVGTELCSYSWTCCSSLVPCIMSTKLLERTVEEFYANNGFQLCSDVVLQIHSTINQGTLAKRLLNEIADELDKWHYNSAVVKVAGGSAGIGGAIAGSYECMPI